MALDLLYFAWVREAVGTGQERVELPEGVTTISALVDWLAARGGGYAEAFAQPDRIRAAIDERFVPLDATIGSAREVALFPPVTGG
ncbi:molybdopterin converting factor subunit 1 [Stakelama marina]|uniref:Molybdopterin synthase sulfur carrier subunit n=1 Tax=Stakelama marina TaxID=2826939 RepID=A0A8T4IHE7_9SPHN|nr:molybdopterin converting factor subunit 1 [Stakelama marina]MBR0553980.1 molybdopterin converting factor subunit 1 [Stakelama marina]